MDFNMDMSRLDGKIALITDAVYGVGSEIAKSLAATGATVVFNNLTQESVDGGSVNYEVEGAEAKGYVCDVTDEKVAQAMVKQIREEVDPIDILANNAGITKQTPVTDMSATDFRQVIDVDLNAPFIISKAVVPEVIEKGGGKIINIRSMMSELGRETASAYAAAKGGLKMLIKNITSGRGQFNIQCNDIDPGYTATLQTASLGELQENGEHHPFDQFIVGRMLATCWGDPVDLTGPSVFPASQAPDFVNGHILYVDDGILAYVGKQP